MITASEARKNVGLYVDSVIQAKATGAREWVENVSNIITDKSQQGETSCTIECKEFCGERLLMAEQMLKDAGFRVNYLAISHSLLIGW